MKQLLDANNEKGIKDVLPEKFVHAEEKKIPEAADWLIKKGIIYLESAESKKVLTTGINAFLMDALLGGIIGLFQGIFVLFL